MDYASLRDHIRSLDVLVKDYLTFRGFMGTLKAFENDTKNDKDKGFRVARIVDHLLSFVSAFDVVGLQKFWQYLDERFFVSLDSSFLPSLRKLEVCLYRHYICQALHAGRKDKVTDFFEKTVGDLMQQNEWRDWFVILFLPNPEQHPTFQHFFSKHWVDTFVLSLSNFLATVFEQLPPPSLVELANERVLRKQVEAELQALRLSLKQGPGDVGVGGWDKRKQPGKGREDITWPKKEGAVSGVGSVHTWDLASSSDNDEDPLPAPSSMKEMLASSSSNLGVQKEQTRDRSGVSPAPPLSPLPSPLPQGTSADGGARRPSSKDTLRSAISLTTRSLQDKEMELELKSFGPSDSKLFGSDSEMKLESDSGPAKRTKSAAAILGTEEISQRGDEEPKRPAALPLSGSLPAMPAQSSLGVGREFSAPSRLEDTRLDPPSSAEMTDRLNEALESENSDSEYPTDERVGLDYQEKSLSILSQETYTEHKSSIIQCKLSPDVAASADASGVVKLWGLQGGLKTHKTLSLNQSFGAMEWDSQAQRLYIGMKDGSLRIYDSSQKSITFKSSAPQFNAAMEDLAVDPTATYVVTALSTGSDSGTMQLWNARTLKVENMLRESHPVLHSARINHNGNMIVTGAADGRVRVFDRSTLKCIMNWMAHTCPISCVRFSVDETSVFSLATDGTLSQWSMHREGQQLSVVATNTPSTRPRTPSFSLQAMVSSSTPALPTFPRAIRRESFGSLRGLSSTTQTTPTFACDPDGSYLLAATPANHAVIYQIGSSTPVEVLQGHQCRVTCVDWSETQNVCVTGCADGSVRLYRLINLNM